MILCAEEHVEWIDQCLRHMREREFSTIEATTEAEADWVDHTNAVANATLYPRGNSWYLGANIRGKPRVFMPYVGNKRSTRKGVTRSLRATMKDLYFHECTPSLDIERAT